MQPCNFGARTSSTNGLPSADQYSGESITSISLLMLDGVVLSISPKASDCFPSIAVCWATTSRIPESCEDAQAGLDNGGDEHEGGCSLHAHMRQMERSHRQRLELRIAQTRATEPFAPWCGAGSAECCLERAAPQIRRAPAFMLLHSMHARSEAAAALHVHQILLLYCRSG